MLEAQPNVFSLVIENVAIAELFRVFCVIAFPFQLALGSTAIDSVQFSNENL